MRRFMVTSWSNGRDAMSSRAGSRDCVCTGKVSRERLLVQGAAK